jgi:hypothetical protein
VAWRLDNNAPFQAPRHLSIITRALVTDRTVLPTRPLSSSEHVLRDKFAESLATQSEMMDKLAQQLITLELAIPGLYATVLKLLAGEAATVPLNRWVYAAFACWFAALLLALVSLIPRNWRVDPTLLRADANAKGKVLGLEDFYRKSAVYKLWFLIPSALLLAAGIVCSAALLV